MHTGADFAKIIKHNKGNSYVPYSGQSKSRAPTFSIHKG
ncbi:hypothetical protein THIOSC13_160013 [uncultured Thiomicrorhabdus sp.]